jgi:hypothetical protein
VSAAAPNTEAVDARIIAPIALLALAAPAPAFAQDDSGGTGVPLGGNGGVRSIPGQSAPAPAPASAEAGPRPAPPVVARAPRRLHPPVTLPVAHAAKSGGDVVDVPVPHKRGKPAALPSTTAAPAASLPMTGFDLGLFTAAGLLMTGIGLLLSAVVGPRPRRGASSRRPA